MKRYILSEKLLTHMQPLIKQAEESTAECSAQYKFGMLFFHHRGML